MTQLRQATQLPRLIGRRSVALARAIHREERGQDVLEFVLLTPFILFLIFAIVDFGLALGASHQVNHAVREAARAGAVGADAPAIRQTAIDQSLDLLGGSALSCPLTPADESCLEVTWNDGPDGNLVAGDVGDAVTVRANYRYRMLNPFIAWLPIAEIELGACADSRVEFQSAAPVDLGWDCTS